MALVNPKTFINKAKLREVAIGAFNVYNMETIQAVIEGAEEENAPVIIQTTPGTLKYAGINFIVANVEAAARECKVPIALHLDHCSSYEIIVQCIKCGYTSVMIDCSELPYEENVRSVREIVKIGHAADVLVEGEIGRIEGVEDEKNISGYGKKLTKPSEAYKFAEDTGVDILAVAIGTAHGEYKGEPELDFKRLERINEDVNIPLVLHGASGVPDSSIKRSIKNGISKVNIATELKIPFSQSIKSYFHKKPDGINPREYLECGKNEVKNVVKKKIKLFGSNNFENI